jgi:hypothetical protein
MILDLGVWCKNDLGRDLQYCSIYIYKMLDLGIDYNYYNKPQ